MNHVSSFCCSHDLSCDPSSHNYHPCVYGNNPVAESSSLREEARMGGCCGGQKLQRLRSAFFDIVLPVFDKVFDCLLIWHYYKVRKWLANTASLRKSQAGNFLDIFSGWALRLDGNYNRGNAPAGLPGNGLLASTLQVWTMQDGLPLGPILRTLHIPYCHHSMVSFCNIPV